MTSERLFSAWRLAHPRGVASDGLAHAALDPEPGKTLFETLDQSGIADERTYIVARTAHSFTILNVFPYTSGHVMVLPRRAVPGIGDLNDEEFVDLWSMVRDASTAVKAAFGPNGLNIGINEGEAGGGSYPDHLHVHVVPRWNADTNFMSAAAETRILPLALSESWRLVRDAWPTPVAFEE